MAAQAYIKQFAYKSLTSWEFRDFFVQARRAPESLRSVEYSRVLGSTVSIAVPRMYAYLRPACLECPLLVPLSCPECPSCVGTIALLIGALAPMVHSRPYPDEMAP